MFDQSQLLKGILEGCILRILSRQTTYGYEIVSLLSEYGFNALTEGTIYPLLLRLEKKSLIDCEFRKSSSGPSRKYYTLTPNGTQYLSDFTQSWKQVSQSVNRIFEEDAL